ncbi:hypothetical protein SAMN05660706_12541 [Desulfoscipio geothermicus DSM 3669]|uniref:Uncharacterized protein n=1 Tax=Desulfoscipio geothermicus DSM 3669 TaxID=1121426 RepID=A0A1I6E421_9FIRM|nr:hypothetical protein SAMN05660706_12541 [Desulfoscipio geothermicus DSM 3669]
MSKLYCQTIEVQIQNGLPIAFRWRNCWYQVTGCIVKQTMPSRWEPWRDLIPRYRCETRQGMVCDLVKNYGQWILERVWD